jgi:hypothetical protein
MDGLELVLRKGYDVTFSVDEIGFIVAIGRDGEEWRERGVSPEAAFIRICHQYKLLELEDNDTDGRWPSPN